MREKTKAAVTLALITPVLTELFSANMGPVEVLNPVGLLFQFLAYGIPVLLIREIAARRRVGLPGLFLMGMAYSLFNEGIISKTLFFGLPGSGLEAYDGFTLGRIHLVWAVIVTMWHALHAVVFPIALASTLFPRVREQSWLSVPVQAVFLFVWVPAGLLGFMNLNPEYAHWGYFGGFAAAIATLLLVGAHLPRKTPFFTDAEPGSSMQVLVGMLFYVVVVVGAFVAAQLGAPFPLVLIWPYGAVTVLYLGLRRKRWTTYLPVAFIALGNYGLGSFGNMLFQLGADSRRMDRIATLALLSALFALITARALLRRRRQRGEQTAGGDA
jgi:hypothetical protein